VALHHIRRRAGRHRRQPVDQLVPVPPDHHRPVLQGRPSRRQRVTHISGALLRISLHMRSQPLDLRPQPGPVPARHHPRHHARRHDTPTRPTGTGGLGGLLRGGLLRDVCLLEDHLRVGAANPAPRNPPPTPPPRFPPARPPRQPGHMGGWPAPLPPPWHARAPAPPPPP